MSIKLAFFEEWMPTLCALEIYDVFENKNFVSVNDLIVDIL